jgi:tRNA dimethylallyltransferase
MRTVAHWSEAFLKNRLIFVAGANASGKSSTGVRLAQLFNGEVVSADSRQVYKRMDLGTGKLTRDEMQGIEHHMIDVAEPGTAFTLYDYQQGAQSAISRILDKGKLPIIAGGTGLYVDCISEGYVLVPVQADKALRQELVDLDRAELLNLIAQEQSEALTFLQDADKRRLIRAIEIIRGGIRYAETRQRQQLCDHLKIGIRWDRNELRSRIRKRLADRIEQGMIEEVEDLRKSGVPEQFLFDMGLEYRFVLDYLEGRYGSVGEMAEKLEIAIGQFAKRQMTWFGRHKDIVWIEGGEGAANAAAELVRNFLTRP